MERRKVEKIRDKYQVLKRNKYSNIPHVDNWNKHGRKYTLQGLETLTREGSFEYLMSDEIVDEISEYQIIRETRKQKYGRR